MTTKRKASCRCVIKFDELLEARNTRLVLAHHILAGISTPIVATERIRNLRDGKKAATIIPNYCPFCGAKYNLKEK